jgi:hypothetical protein
MNKMVEGTIIGKQQHPKRSALMCFSRESSSNDIDERNLQPEKQCDSRISTFRGI